MIRTRATSADVLTGVAMAIVLIVSMWLRAAFPISAIGDGTYDDLLFVKLATSIGSGQWLGAYDNLTMAKGAAYSVFMALNRPTGIPLKLAEHFVYLISAAYFAHTVWQVFNSRLAAIAVFVVLAFNPLFWVAGMGGRVVRENLYMTVSLLLFTACARACLLRRFASASEELSAKWRLLIGTGAIAGIYWLTREEGAWLVPALSLLVLHWLFVAAKRIRDGKREIAAMVRFVLIPLISFSVIVGTFNTLNLIAYGVFRNNDFRSSDFQGAYGALSRISHERWARYVVFPADARQKAYLVSAAARELRPYFEGEGGETWRSIGCGQTRIVPCSETLSGWFMWSLRGAVQSAGHYRNAADAQRFYLRLAREINEGCEQSLIACGPARSTLAPPWREGYLEDTIDASLAVFATLVSLGKLPPHIAPSVGSPEQLALFARVTNGPLASNEHASWHGIRHRTAAAVARALGRFCQVAVPISMAGWAVLLMLSAVLRRWHVGHVLCAALIAAIVTRVGLLGFLDATSIPSNHMLYLSPVVPMALVLPFCVGWLAKDLLGRR